MEDIAGGEEHYTACVCGGDVLAVRQFFRLGGLHETPKLRCTNLQLWASRCR